MEYRASQDQAREHPARHPVVIAGAGPVGLSAALDLSGQGVPVVLVDDDDKLPTGSRAICFAKRSLEIFDRLGCGQSMVDRGVTWNVGRVFLKQEELYNFNLLPEEGHARPAFINLQQYYVESLLLDQARERANVDIRWWNKVCSVTARQDCVELEIDTPDGPYRMEAEWLIACDGARSPIRTLMGLESRGRVFKDRFLIVDIKVEAGFPAERWFWFDPPFHPGQSVLLHKQPDNIWRVDFQLGWEADPEGEQDPERVSERIRALLGKDVAFSIEWVSVYTFACRRMGRFRKGRVLFAGDSAHGVSPFGARGANSGIQDAENLAWKLRFVLSYAAPERLLDSYDAERIHAADENILNSSRSTDFITPKSTMARAFRDAALELARDFEFARRLVNSGRLSTPAIYDGSPLNTPDIDAFALNMRPGSPAADAPVLSGGARDWLLRHLGGEFVALYFAGVDMNRGADLEILRGLRQEGVTVRILVVIPRGGAHPCGVDSVEDIEGFAWRRYDASPGALYLVRPDQHICARWRRLDLPAVRAAISKATAND